MAAPVRILIADDHEIFRKGFQTLLRNQSELKIIGEAENGLELIAQAKKLEPDVIITDIQMPVMDGIEAVKQINQWQPETGIIALTMFNEDHLIVDMLEAGAKGYILKNTNRQELIEAVLTVFKGGNYFCNATSNKIARLIGLCKFKNHAIKNQPKFNSKELDIIRLICQEHSSKQIAAINKE